jgi:hypothetical protein
MEKGRMERLEEYRFSAIAAYDIKELSPIRS